MLLLPQRVALIVTTRTRPRQTRHGVSEGRGVTQFPPPAGRQGGGTCQSCIFSPRGWGVSMNKHPTCSNESSSFLKPSIGLDTIVRIILFPRRGSHRKRSRWRHCRGHFMGQKKSRNFDYFQRTVSKMPSQALENSLFSLPLPLGPSIEKLLDIGLDIGTSGYQWYSYMLKPLSIRRRNRYQLDGGTKCYNGACL